MIVRFVKVGDASPVGKAFSLCPEHAQRQKVPEHLALQILSRDQGPSCDECTAAHVRRYSKGGR